MALRHVRTGEDLVAGQRERVDFWEGRGNPEALASARELLLILEESLRLHRRDLERLTRNISAHHA